MHIQLLVPDLLFNRPGNEKDAHPLFEMDLPSLTLLLDAAVENESPLDEEYCLAEACGLDVNPPYGIAALTAEAEGLSGRTGCWLRADPVQMQVSQDSVYCLGQQNLHLSSEEALALINSINDLFKEEGFGLEMGCQPLHWYIQVEEGPHSVPLSRVIGKPILNYLPKDQPWQKRLTEVQMLLKTHPVNLSRKKSGLPAVDSLWVWGKGHYPKLRHSRKEVLYGDSELARAVALSAELPYFALPENLDTLLSGPYQKIMWVSHQLSLALMRGDLAYWQNQVSQLERSLFLPLLLALKDRLIDSIILDFSKGYSYVIYRNGLKRWWRRPLPLKTRLSHSLNN